jgi:hypothetical protein
MSQGATAAGVVMLVRAGKAAPGAKAEMVATEIQAAASAPTAAIEATGETALRAETGVTVAMAVPAATGDISLSLFTLWTQTRCTLKKISAVGWEASRGAKDRRAHPARVAVAGTAG